MIVHIVDGTYELFRQFFARPSHLNRDGEEVAAVRAVLGSMLAMLEEGATHLGVATDSVVESFRNDMYEGYKTGEGMDPQIVSQFPLLELGLEALGVATFGMVKHEADDGMASLAAIAQADNQVEKVFLCTPDKDLAQAVVGDRVVQLDRRNNKVYDAEGVTEKFGVPPESIPDYLALVGDSADGFPGIAGWGAKTAATVLSRYQHIDQIPLAAGQWDITVRGSQRLVDNLANNFDDAILFRRLATLDTTAPTVESVGELKWAGPSADLPQTLKRFDAPKLLERCQRLNPAA